jgi:adhesin/invasin
MMILTFEPRAGYLFIHSWAVSLFIYYGNNVALIDKYTLKHNPVAVTVGVNYTPIPLVTLGVEHQQGEGGDNETTFNFELNYRLGVPWEKQIDPAMVGFSRTLAGNRYDLVERNNDVVLDYKKQNLIQLGVPPDSMSGKAGDTDVLKPSMALTMLMEYSGIRCYGG